MRRPLFWIRYRQAFLANVARDSAWSGINARYSLWHRHAHPLQQYSLQLPSTMFKPRNFTHTSHSLFGRRQQLSRGKVVHCLEANRDGKLQTWPGNQKHYWLGICPFRKRSNWMQRYLSCLWNLRRAMDHQESACWLWPWWRWNHWQQFWKSSWAKKA